MKVRERLERIFSNIYNMFNPREEKRDTSYGDIYRNYFSRQVQNLFDIEVYSPGHVCLKKKGLEGKCDFFGN